MEQVFVVFEIQALSREFDPVTILNFFEDFDAVVAGDTEVAFELEFRQDSFIGSKSLMFANETCELFKWRNLHDPLRATTS